MTEGGSSDRGTFAAVLPDEAAADTRVRRATVEMFAMTRRVSIDQGWSRAAEALARALRDARSLHSRERRFIGDALHRMVRGLRRLTALSGQPRQEALQLYLTWLIDEWQWQAQDPAAEGPPDSHPALPPALVRAAGDAGVDAAGVVERAAGFDRWLAELPEDDPALVEKLGAALSYPDWLVTAVLADHGPARTREILAAQNGRAPLTVRVNLIKGSREQLAALLRDEGVSSTPTELSPTGLVLHTRVNVYGLRAFREGWMELQDEGSQLIAEVVAPPPGGQVVDACAGAGGKTLALSGMMGNKGRLLALDIEERKLAELRKRTRRAGLTNVQAALVPPSGPDETLNPLVGQWLRRGADRVLVDAPCSGLGVLRRNPEARWRITRRDLDALAVTQRKLLSQSARLVAPHGRLIYATCTILERENHAVVADFLSAHPEFSEVPIKEILGARRAAQMGDGVRLQLLPSGGPKGRPDRPAGPDGFFAAVLRRNQSV